MQRRSFFNVVNVVNIAAVVVVVDVDVQLVVGCTEAAAEVDVESFKASDIIS